MLARGVAEPAHGRTDALLLVDERLEGVSEVRGPRRELQGAQLRFLPLPLVDDAPRGHGEGVAQVVGLTWSGKAKLRGGLAVAPEQRAPQELHEVAHNAQLREARASRQLR